MIAIRHKQILIDGKPRLILCGEIHYFRLAKEDWQDRIDKLKQAGCNAVASYVPWICHEASEGAIDLDGHITPNLDLGSFIDLCQENNLFFFVRPGPFIMAEMKNEGLPFWLYLKHPEIVPVGWDGKRATTRTVDYLAPNFLKAAANWYSAVMAVIAPRQYPKGGNIIGVQLDNEIGMLSWVSNCPELTTCSLASFANWLNRTYDAATLASRYPFDLGDRQAREQRIRSPQESYAAQLRQDLGYFMRQRYARYVSTLRKYAEDFGVTDVPFFINVHGTSGGRGFTYPIGISQLYESYTNGPGYVAGSDIYLGSLTMDNFQDLYLINALMDAVQSQDQPLTSIEFECGDGNYGNTFGSRYNPSAADFKTRMCVAQGNRMLNYYLFAGGTNYRMKPEPEDGNGRIAFTGERHGFAAPISPEGRINYTYPRMARVIQTMSAVADKLATTTEEHDDIAFAFIPDYFMTEACYPRSAKMKNIIQNIESNRAFGAWEVMARSILLAGYRFGAVDIQNKPLAPQSTPVLVLPSACYMGAKIQQKLADYLFEGGSLLLYGEVPTFDLEGNRCVILAEALGTQPTDTRTANEFYYLSIVADGWAARTRLSTRRPEVRSSKAQVYSAHQKVQAILHIYGTNEVCGFEAKVGLGRAIVIGNAYESDVDLFETALTRLGAAAQLKHDYEDLGIFMTSSATKAGERFIHILNLDCVDKRFMVRDKGRELFGGRQIVLQSNDGVMLPENVSFEGVTILYATAEITSVSRDSIAFRLTQPKDIIALQTDRTVVPSDDYDIQYTSTDLSAPGESVTLIASRKHAKVDDSLTIRFQ